MPSTLEHNNLFLHDFPYHSQRMPVVASHGVVATSEPLAAQAGLWMLRRGGSAVDAALATAIALTVLEPTSNGIGSDAFALVWEGDKLHGLNASGRAPAGHTLERFAAEGHTSMPERGWRSVTVPGAPAAWKDLHDRFGKLPFATLFEPAIDYARHGFPVGPVTAEAWGVLARSYRGPFQGPEFAPWWDLFAPGGETPQPGAIFQSPGHAWTLERIAASGSEDFYRGEIASRIAVFAKDSGGLLSVEDLRNHTNTWVEPVKTNYRGHDVWEIPPNGQGIAALSALNILEGFELDRDPRESIASYHLQIEAMKLAFADALRYVADPARAPVPVAGLLDKGYAAERRALIGDRAGDPAPGTPPGGGTVYLCAADADGMMVSMIQSNYQGFGSGIVIPGTGISIQNRGHGFVLDPRHPNALAPGKRPYHTIIPAFLSKDGVPIGPFGVMGGYMQPQGHVQMVVNQVDYGMNPQAALDAPRWQWLRGRQVVLELSVPDHIVRGLASRGHTVEVRPHPASFGKGQIIRRLGNGVYVAGSEPRCDGCAVGF